MDKILFVKYSNDRANQFAICTEIFANGDKKLLKKRATTESARECVEVAKSYLGLNDYQPNMLTRGLYYRGVE